MHIVTVGSSASVSQVTPAMMEPDNYYIVELPAWNDSGEESVCRDFVWFAEDSPPGVEWKGRKVKCCKFCSVMRTLTFSMMPGAKFFGPITLTIDASGEDMLRTPVEEASHDKMGAILAAAQRRQQQ